MFYSRQVIGGRRMVGTSYVACTVCGVQFKEGTVHPERDYIEMVNGWPVNTRCPHVGEVVPTNFEWCDDRHKYRWVRAVCEWR